ncbi:hypothetical protein KY284_001263 [Solanum tuberosum]|nr:hypothetical protein KY284_001263 [Solanum tuberosum]
MPQGQLLHQLQQQQPQPLPNTAAANITTSPINPAKGTIASLIIAVLVVSAIIGEAVLLVAVVFGESVVFADVVIGKAVVLVATVISEAVMLVV